MAGLGERGGADRDCSLCIAFHSLWFCLCGRRRAPAAAPPDDGQWTMPAKNFASTRYSELNEINTQNVSQLQVAFTFSIGVNKGQEAAPLVVDNTMYIVSPYPNILYALDLTKPGAPLKWKYRAASPRPPAQGVACCDVVNRGAVLLPTGKNFFNTLDGQTIALDAETGKEIWRTKLGNINIGETITMAPLVVKGKVSSATPAARWACAAGSPRWMRTPARWCGRPTTPVPMPTS